jgi:uncharacterized protein YbjQ (UPF0145 family)
MAGPPFTRTWAEMATCIDCGKPKGIFEGVGGRCQACYIDHVAGLSKEEAAEARSARIVKEAEIEAVLVTTEMQPDIGIQKRITIVTAEVAYGMNIFKDLFASVRNIVGGRSEAVQKTMRDARETVLYELKREAHAVGGNAVIAVDLDYTQIGDGGWNMVMLVASGTAVVAESPK